MGMKSIIYEPFSSPQEFSELMAGFFGLFSSYEPDSFPFEWLQKFSDVQVICKNRTSDRIGFPTSAALQKAIENCEKINHPRQSWLDSSSADHNWTGYVEGAISIVRREVEIPQAQL